ncbi:MAG: peptidase dimerization domain-containing protein, partial [Steroidobacteraceae bacterium]|nr:peptidase dimerization domain-containing protein [Steroidobacteraceae bacterium]
TEGVHSGAGTGIAPSTFRLLRQLLGRVEDAVTGDLLIDELAVVVPQDRIEQARAAARALGETMFRKLPFVPGAEPVTNSPFELVINNTWRPTLTVTGADGLPPVGNAGNVLLPRIEVKLSFRLPPTADAAAAAAAVKHKLEAEPPYGARVRFEVGSSLGGWNAPPVAPWLEVAMMEASRATFGHEAMYLGTGGSIPFIGMLGARYPGTQFLVTGVLGPASNAHGPNEFLHLATARNLTVCVAAVIEAHARR